MPKEPLCKYCGEIGHYEAWCFYKPRKPIKVKTKTHAPKPKIKPESDKTRSKRLKLRRAFFRQYPDGVFTCYLQISANCMKELNTGTVLLEHVKPRVRYPNLTYEVKNVKPSCSFCNGLKGSRELEQLAKIYPQLKRYLPVDEWLGL